MPLPNVTLRMTSAEQSAAIADFRENYWGEDRCDGIDMIFVRQVLVEFVKRHITSQDAFDEFEPRANAIIASAAERGIFMSLAALGLYHDELTELISASSKGAES